MGNKEISANTTDAEDLIVVLTSISDAKAAETLAHQVVSRRLAACCSIVPGITSIYRWQGELTRDDEALIVIKTAKSRFGELEAFMHEFHPYEVPELIALSAQDCTNEYLLWMSEQIS